MMRGQLVNPPPSSDTTVLWVPTNDAGFVAAELEAVLERDNKPLHKLKFRYALEQLARSINVMLAARAADRSSPLRLEGDLALLIDEGWAITSFGLESLRTHAAIKATWSGWRGATYWRTSSEIAARPDDESPDLWDEAIDWIGRSESREILARYESRGVVGFADAFPGVAQVPGVSSAG